MKGFYTMRRLFLDTPLADTMRVTGDDAHHLTRVLRAKIGERVRVRAMDGRLAEAEIAGFEEDAVRLSLLFEEEAEEERGERVLIISLLKGDKLDLVVQKATELGITRILPVVTAHAVVRYDAAKAEKKRGKWQKIAVEAAKQCGRVSLPTVEDIRPMEEALRLCGEMDMRLFFYEADEEHDVKSVLRASVKGGERAGSVAFLIGPEGGFSAAEAEQVMDAGFTPVTFGRNILRAETAAIAACAVVQYEWM
ncbi:16S rRNA (uracil(1498)-N(3))-methyltransferase [Selenomonas sp. TAMA-11512]|nr:16S rRNA (uracil(1498)-N(3))-methyltransferase [Selenomonas sp. TAMA-11512]